MFDHSKIMTYSGKLVDISSLKDDVDINDIAHSLSMKCRFGGHTSMFYSVAEHSLLTEQLVEKVVGIPSEVEELKLRLAALLHDSMEAYLPDFASPNKKRFFYQASTMSIPCDIAALEKTMLNTIGCTLHLPFLCSYEKEVHRLDMIALVTEARDLLPSTEGFPTDYLPIDREDRRVRLGQSHFMIKTSFLQRYQELAERLHMIDTLEEFWEAYLGPQTRKRPPTLDPVVRVMMEKTGGRDFATTRRRIQKMLEGDQFVSVKEKDNCGVSWKTYCHRQSEYYEACITSKNRVENIR